MVKSGERGSHSTQGCLEIMLLPNTSRRTFKILLDVWHVAPSCWNQVDRRRLWRWSLGIRNIFNISVYRAVFTVLSKKYGLTMPHLPIRLFTRHVTASLQWPLDSQEPSSNNCVYSLCQLNRNVPCPSSKFDQDQFLYPWFSRASSKRIFFVLDNLRGVTFVTANL